MLSLLLILIVSFFNLKKKMIHWKSILIQITFIEQAYTIQKKNDKEK